MGNLTNLNISSSYQSLIHLGSDNTASSTLVGLQDGYGNSIGIGVNTTGDLSISGSFTSSLQQGYVWVGNSSGKTTTVPTSSFGGGGGTGSADLSALNAFTSSQNTKNSTLASYTGSNDTKWNTLGTQTGSYVTSAITGSSLITASFSGNTLTFTKGNGTQFGVVIPDVSGSTINTGSFATTGSNQFTGNQTITGSNRPVGITIQETGVSGGGGIGRYFIGTNSNGTGTLVISSSLNDRYIEFNPDNGWMEVYATTNYNSLLSTRGRLEVRNTYVGENYQIYYPTGSNQQTGTAVLDGGNPASVDVNNTLVTANSIIMLTKQTNNHPNAGPVVVSSKGTGYFTITSNHNSDTDTVGWFIINNT